MAKSKEDIKYATSQARHSEDEAVRVGYHHGDPLEAGKIADSEPIHVFSSAHNISKAQQQEGGSDHSSQLQQQQQQQQQRKDPSDDNTNKGEREDFTTGPPRLPKKGPPSAGYQY